MKELTEEQLETAFRFWFGTYQHRQIDREIEKFFNIEPRRDWLQQIRAAQHFTQQEVSDKMNVHKSTYRELELSEHARTITMASLVKAADAMNCEVVYGLRPKTGQKIARQLWEKIVALYQGEHWVQTKPEHLKARALAATARYKLQDPKIKKKLLRF